MYLTVKPRLFTNRHYNEEFETFHIGFYMLPTDYWISLSCREVWWILSVTSMRCSHFLSNHNKTSNIVFPRGPRHYNYINRYLNDLTACIKSEKMCRRETAIQFRYRFPLSVFRSVRLKYRILRLLSKALKRSFRRRRYLKSIKLTILMAMFDGERSL